MKFCIDCGKAIEDAVVACPHCGASQVEAAQPVAEPVVEPDPVIVEVQPTGYQGSANPEDTGSVLWAVLGALIPIVGLVLYLVWKDSKPLSAKRAGMGAIIGFCLGVAGMVL
ncbi:MAG: zinc-ribbon domain-containing protein [Mogibacterium sp.]|nr:zinc-ribbon domain-containing protein [Mogibacterium sp.]